MFSSAVVVVVAIIDSFPFVIFTFIYSKLLILFFLQYIVLIASIVCVCLFDSVLFGLWSLPVFFYPLCGAEEGSSLYFTFVVSVDPACALYFLILLRLLFLQNREGKRGSQRVKDLRKNFPVYRWRARLLDSTAIYPFIIIIYFCAPFLPLSLSLCLTLHTTLSLVFFLSVSSLLSPVLHFFCLLSCCHTAAYGFFFPLTDSHECPSSYSLSCFTSLAASQRTELLTIVLCCGCLAVFFFCFIV